MPAETAVNGEARQGVAVLTQRINDCQAASGRRWDQHDRTHACMSQQLADVEKGIHQISLALAAGGGGVEVRKAELDHSSKVWVAVIGVIVVLVNAGVQIAVALIR